MQHFHQLHQRERDKLFHRKPISLSPSSPRQLLARGLGAALYMPATRPALLSDVKKQYARGCGTVIICLEDSIRDEDLPLGEKQVAQLLTQLQQENPGDLPLVFLRVRSPEHLRHMLTQLDSDQLEMLSGFALPKFGATLDQAHDFLSVLRSAQRGVAHPLFGLPILESPNLGFLESRQHDLVALRDMLREHEDRILGVRIGATDLSSIYGVRRSPDITVYDVTVLNSIISDIVNVFGRSEHGFVVSGSVWEHYIARERLFKPMLRQSPFRGDEEELRLRTELIMEQLDGFIREVMLDKANGILGKTVIHPTHVSIVNALQIVTLEEYLDAQAVLNLGSGGAMGSTTGTKMNEGRPHYNWAQNILLRAETFGVLESDITFPHVLHVLLSSEVRSS